MVMKLAPLRQREYLAPGRLAYTKCNTEKMGEDDERQY
jgi:hypothetical protein